MLYEAVHKILNEMRLKHLCVWQIYHFSCGKVCKHHVSGHYYRNQKVFFTSLCSSSRRLVTSSRSQCQTHILSNPSFTVIHVFMGDLQTLDLRCPTLGQFTLPLRGILHPKICILSSFTHPQVVANLYEFLSSAKHKDSCSAPLTSIVEKKILWK